jgi:hypothetical protein
MKYCAFLCHYTGQQRHADLEKNKMLQKQIDVGNLQRARNASVGNKQPDEDRSQPLGRFLLERQSHEKGKPVITR